MDRPTRGLDHGAWVPLMAMYPEADIPVLQLSLPDLDPEHLFEVGRRLAPLRDEGVLVVGSRVHDPRAAVHRPVLRRPPGAPAWSEEFDRWAAEALATGDIDSLFAFREKAPGMPFAHPTVEHFAPLFVTLGAAAKPDDAPKTAIEGYFLGLSKRSIERLLEVASRGRTAGARRPASRRRRPRAPRGGRRQSIAARRMRPRRRRAPVDQHQRRDR